MMQHPRVGALNGLRAVEVEPVFNGCAGCRDETDRNDDEWRNERKGGSTIHDTSSYR